MTAATRANALPILIAASVMMSLAMGMRQCLGLFLPPMTQALALSASDFTFAIAVQNIVWGLVQAPLGAVADRWGLRPVMVLGAIAYVAAMAIMTATNGVWILVLAQALIGIGIACTGSSLAMTATARAASPERRSIILGIVGAFSSVGTLVIAPALQALLGAWDWRWGGVLFVLLALAMVPAAMITGRVDRVPQPTAPRASVAGVIAEALRNRRFVVLCATHFVCGLQLIFINTHLPNYLALCGQDPMLSATALAIIGGINIAGCLLAGYLGQRHAKNVLLGLTYLARSVVLTIYFLLPPTPATTILFAAAMGMLWLGVIPLVSGYVADLFGTRNMATLLGVSFVIHQMGSVTGAWGGGMIFDAFGNYDLAWRIGVSIGIVAGIVQIVFGGPARTPSDARPAPAAG
ncbi:MAG: MFS transporter [Reyranella sp.]|uniref:MFS transporter n=1 Tax=Reyranella sp. TaxID=1929291 RepID=UPI003D0B26EC